MIIFNADGTVYKRLVLNDLLNSPWGLAISTRKFGKYSHALLVGNHGDGTIQAYGIKSGTYLGTLKDDCGDRLIVDGLWSLIFKSETSEHLYFTAGPDNGNGGVIGFIKPLNNH